MSNELTTTEKTATLIHKMEGWKWTGDACLYELSHPMQDRDGNDHKFIVISAVISFDNVIETFIFPAKDATSTDVLSYSEMDGSRRGTLDHVEVLNECGYTVLPELIT